MINMTIYMLICFITMSTDSFGDCLMWAQENVYSDVCGQSILCHLGMVGGAFSLSCILTDFILMVLSIDDRGVFKFVILTVGFFFSPWSSNYCCQVYFDWRLTYELTILIDLCEYLFLLLISSYHDYYKFLF